MDDFRDHIETMFREAMEKQAAKQADHDAVKDEVLASFRHAAQVIADGGSGRTELAQAVGQCIARQAQLCEGCVSEFVVLADTLCRISELER